MTSDPNHADNLLPEIPFPEITDPSERIEAYTSYLFGTEVDSCGRLPELFRLLDSDWNVSGEVAWPVFHAVWTGCDDTWPYRDSLSDLIERLNEQGDPLLYLEERDAEAYEALPKHIRIFRGCSVERIYGFAWTTDRAIAEGFARGHRGIRVPDAVIADLTIPKTLVTGVYTERSESEVLIAPLALRDRAIRVRRFF